MVMVRWYLSSKRGDSAEAGREVLKDFCEVTLSLRQNESFK
jgi:hypothetical protein